MTNPTAVFTRGWWPRTTLSDPSNAVYDAGWFLQPDIAVISEALFPLYGPFSDLGLIFALAWNVSLRYPVAFAVQLPCSEKSDFALSTVLGFELRLSVSEEELL